LAKQLAHQSLLLAQKPSALCLPLQLNLLDLKVQSEFQRLTVRLRTELARRLVASGALQLGLQEGLRRVRTDVAEGVEEA
jgi:hypothetical protein